MKLSEYSELVEPADDDLLYIVRPSSPPGNKVTVEHLVDARVLSMASATALPSTLVRRTGDGDIEATSVMLSDSLVLGGATLYSNGIGVIEQREAANPQEYRLYYSSIDPSNYQRCALRASASAVSLVAESAGTGASDIDIILQSDGNGSVRVPNGNAANPGVELLGGCGIYTEGPGNTVTISIGGARVHQFGGENYYFLNDNAHIHLGAGYYSGLARAAAKLIGGTDGEVVGGGV